MLPIELALASTFNKKIKNMKTTLKTFSLLIVSGLALLSSCKKDETPLPAPQVSADKATLSIVSEAADKAILTIVAPGKFGSVTASADAGTVTVDNVTGVGTTTGSAEINYTAPLAIGTYTITINVTDQTSKTASMTIAVTVSTKPPVTLPAGNVSGVLAKNTVYLAQGSLLVPTGQSLTIQEGVTIIFDGDGSQGSPEFAVNGKLYVLGTKTSPVLFTIPQAKRIKANIFAGLWGGIQATTSATEVVLQYTSIEFAGAPAGANNTSVLSGAYTAGTLRYGLLFSSNTGKLVMQNSRIAYTQDDAMRVMGGAVLITNNFYETCGSTGGESINIKSGTTGDVAYNVIYNCATNGMKISDVSGSAPTPQTNINTYNNTIVNSGFRQTATSAHGGSINYEKGARGQIYNNVIANSKFGTRITSDADVPNISLGFNLYYGTEQGIVDQFYPTSGVIVKATSKETASDIAGLINVNDPKFVNFSWSSFSSASAASTTVDFLGTTDFHVQAGSPVLAKGKTGFTVGSTLTVNGIAYPVPAPSAVIGALGTN